VRAAGFGQWIARRLCHYMTDSRSWPSLLLDISEVVTENGTRTVKDGLKADLGADCPDDARRMQSMPDAEHAASAVLGHSRCRNGGSALTPMGPTPAMMWGIAVKCDRPEASNLRH
ncbi:MAG TPA: hypothetical protein VND19_01885, partial [Acetobacteraceae bacterium]|nr:hypothetical protein [Acetobacteraceae bacterium]